MEKKKTMDKKTKMIHSVSCRIKVSLNEEDEEEENKGEKAIEKEAQ